VKIDDRLHGISTLLITISQGNQIQGTGFFYQELGPKDPNKEAQWRDIKKIWIVTNRHILLPKVNGNELLPDNFIFHMRKIVKEGIVWDPFVLDTDEVMRRVRLHKDTEIDIAMVRVDDLLISHIEGGVKYMAWSGVCEEDLPGTSRVSAEVGDDVLIIGYPKGFYDKKNVFPIVKSGIIATRWGLGFMGRPVFLIDAKLFPGSSGSIVITKPINTIATANGQVLYSPEGKQFAFLGIFSGEPFVEKIPIELDDMTIIRKDSFNVGVVWYGYLVAEIARGGVTLE